MCVYSAFEISFETMGLSICVWHSYKCALCCGTINNMSFEHLESEQPMKILRTWPNLEENEIIKLSLSFIPELPEKLYDLIADMVTIEKF